MRGDRTGSGDGPAGRADRTHAGWRAALRTLPGVSRVMRAVRALRAFATPIARARSKLERSKPAELLQPATTTWADRHPLLFDAVRTQLAATDRPHILSFGCATGEEAFTLARYLPQAEIAALDINPACIARARRAARGRPEAARIVFACAGAPDPAMPECYDAILCLSVLRHWRLDAELPDVCDDIMGFDRFAAAIEMLDRALRPGGLLVLWGCNFRLADTALAQAYRRLRVPGIGPQAPPFYGPDGRRLDVACYGDFLFRKR